MKSQIEIRDKLTYYQTMLSSIRIAQTANSPEVFIAISQRFPNEAIALLRSSQNLRKIKKKGLVASSKEQGTSSCQTTAV